jgi:hypothetical protein
MIGKIAITVAQMVSKPARQERDLGRRRTHRAASGA